MGQLEIIVATEANWNAHSPDTISYFLFHSTGCGGPCPLPFRYGPWDAEVKVGEPLVIFGEITLGATNSNANAATPGGRTSRYIDGRSTGAFFARMKETGAGLVGRSGHDYAAPVPPTPITLPTSTTITVPTLGTTSTTTLGTATTTSVTTTSSTVTTTTILNASTTTSSSTSTTSSTVTTSTVPLDHFRCYPGKPAKGTPKFASRTVRLADDLEDKSTVVDSVASLCNPADKAGEGIADPTAHLACYKIKPVTKKPKFVARDVVTADQFGSLSLRVSGAATLCVPSEKDGLPSLQALDHFKCYRAKVTKGKPAFAERTVAVTDQFETKNVVVLKPLALCAAVNKNEEGVRRPSARLVCYQTKDVKGQSGFAKRTAAVRNQFGTLTLEVKKPKTLCLPAVGGSASGRR